MSERHFFVYQGNVSAVFYIDTHAALGREDAELPSKRIRSELLGRLSIKRLNTWLTIDKRIDRAKVRHGGNAAGGLL